MNQKELLNQIKNFSCTQVSAEYARHREETGRLEQLRDTQMYDASYLDNLVSEENAKHKSGMNACQKKVAESLDKLYDAIVNELPDIHSESFKYAYDFAQILGDKMTNEQAFKAISPLRGKITTLEVLRHAYEKNGATVLPFSEFTFYEPARDAIPAQTTETVFDQAKRFVLSGNFVDGNWYLQQISNKLLGTGTIDFPLQHPERGRKESTIKKVW